ncbi:MAG: hypothetical protein IJZ46_04330 [Bacilli bacterium]|nr:hypothetical protein [Bacilli bacterium]
MTKSEERNIFLKYLSKIYMQNPNLEITSDTIYNELRKFNIEEGKQTRINNESLVGIQVKLNNRFAGKCLSNGYFWVIENRAGKKDEDYYNDIINGIKIYVSIEPENLYRISESLFNFMIQENIIMQCKVAKEMRNDVLVLRVQKKEDAVKVSNYLNNLHYQSKIKPNPFLLDSGKVSMAMDGILSYNSTLSKLIREYLKFRKKLNNLHEVSEKDFANFVKAQLNELKQNGNRAYLNVYNLKSEEELKNFIMIGELIQKNINNTLTHEELFQYQKSNNEQIISPTSKETPQYHKSNNINNKNISFTQEEKEKVLYVINRLSNYYSLEEVHARIMSYINTGRTEFFTRRDGIRYIVEENFPPYKMKNIISDLGWNAIISASNATLQKYGINQLYYAFNKILNNGGIDGFTNQNNVRSYLGFVIPPELLQEVLSNKARENNFSLTAENITNIIISKINVQEKQRSGRK